MTDSQAFETGSIVPNSTEAIASRSLDDFKALFYLYNAKPDTEIRFLKGGKIVELSDIRSLEEQVAAKLGNHETLGQTVSITFMLSNKKIKEFSTWAEFERGQWNTVNEKVQALNLSWNVLIQLPQYKSPQTHSMKVRIGNAIPPKDIIQLIFTSDDISEVMEAQSPGVCKVDFINNIVANELLFIVDEWYKGLRKAPEPIVAQKFLKKYGKYASQLIRLLFPPLLLFIICSYTGYIYPIIGIGQELSINTLQTVLVFLLTIFMVGAFLGSSIEKSIDRLIDQLEVYPNFLITKGDQNAVEDFERNNKKLTNQIFSRVAWILFSIPVSSGIKFLITYFNPLKH
ncbi:MAG: hypothetical protein KME19_11945 [Microcoleus vaginatus WJT46-NPBG5]|jgi:hypothetical protein|nr:hypothetical protein [Microcoleus vaginatus WJT46-NPBG5]